MKPECKEKMGRMEEMIESMHTKMNEFLSAIGDAVPGLGFLSNNSEQPEDKAETAPSVTSQQ